jgi:hypothetical protein
LKGIVFVEFLDMVETRFSVETGERLLESSELESKGIYTSVGTYNAKEMGILLANLVKMTNIPASVLLKDFGRHMFAVFTQRFPQFFENSHSCFDFLPKVQTFVHLEAKKLYEDAELPTFDCSLESPGVLIMKYRSVRNMADLAEGLIEGCVSYFKEDIEIQLETVEEYGPVTVFKLTRRKG